MESTKRRIKSLWLILKFNCGLRGKLFLVGLMIKGLNPDYISYDKTELKYHGATRKYTIGNGLLKWWGGDMSFVYVHKSMKKLVIHVYDDCRCAPSQYVYKNCHKRDIQSMLEYYCEN